MKFEEVSFSTGPNPITKGVDGAIILKLEAQEPVRASVKIFDALGNTVFIRKFSQYAKTHLWEWGLQVQGKKRSATPGSYLALCVVENAKADRVIVKKIIGIKE